MSDILHFFSSYFASGFEIALIVHMLRSIPVGFWIVAGLLFVRYQMFEIFVWVSWVIYPRLWEQPEFKPDNGYPLVSVIIPTRNQAKWLDKAVRSVLACGWPNIEVVVADDCSSDQSWAISKEIERTGRVRVVRTPRQGGKATAVNIGLASVRSDYVLVMDTKNQIETGAIAKMMGVMTQNHRIGAVFCPFFLIEGVTNIVTSWQEWGAAETIPERMVRSKLGMINIVSGGAGFFRTEVLRSIGGYDPGLGDDTDVTLRLRKQRVPLRYCHRALCYAEVPQDFKGLLEQRTRWWRAGIKMRIQKHWDLILPWRYGWLNCLMAADDLFTRVPLTMGLAICVVIGLFFNPFSTLGFMCSAAVFVLCLSWLKGLLVKDFSGMPRWITFAYVPVFGFVRGPLDIALHWTFVMETLRIGARHKRVPLHLWEDSPRW